MFFAALKIKLCHFSNRSNKLQESFQELRIHMQQSYYLKRPAFAKMFTSSP